MRRLCKEHLRQFKHALSHVFYPSDKKWLTRRYRSRFHRNPNISSPKTFTEKIQWLKLNYLDEQLGKYVDKISVRDFVADQIGKDILIPIVETYNAPDEIDFEALPESFVLQCTHDSGSTTIVRHKSELTRHAKREIRAFYKLRLKENYYYAGREKQYRKLTPKIIAVQYLPSADETPADYKFQCANGKIIYIQVDTGRFSHHERILMTNGWQPAPFQFSQYPLPSTPPKQPSCLSEMTRIAMKLSASFPLVRVDLYCVEDKVYFGELTFSPENGFLPYQNIDMDLSLGELLVLEN